MIGALPKVQLVMDGVSCEALVDTGCSKSIAYVSTCSRWTRNDVCVTTVSSERYSCQGMSVVHVQLLSGMYAFVEVLVVSTRPLNFNFILGMNGVSAFRGVTVRTSSDVQFGVEESVFSSSRCGHGLCDRWRKFPATTRHQVPSGNSISERCHRSVKTIAARKPCTIPEAVYCYNVMPRDDNPSSAPTNSIFRYEARQLGLDTVSDCEEGDNV
ncbi:hypothetical protein E2C01_054254 [Portunus trituberculatus]|uniref:Peptidase A2 domain-containing protein n=1 Tax=Portunus trituberculatus TaxID=210409 RepID=A0A5B7GSA1_PORTR|nr:hypothetical protein [Portunus trituberculatus]